MDKEEATRYKYIFSSNMLATKSRQKYTRIDVSYRKNTKYSVVLMIDFYNTLIPSLPFISYMYLSMCIYYFIQLMR